jgi:transcriptional regulator with XRE-family HTH domain
MKNTGDRIALARAELRLSQVQLAERLGIAAEQVSMWETGRRRPRAENLQRLASVLDVRFEWLRSAEGPMRPPDFKDEDELEAFITGRAPEIAQKTGRAVRVLDPACGSAALLTRALTFALSQIPTPTPEAAAKAAVEAALTAQRTQKEDRIEDLVKILLS